MVTKITLKTDYPITDFAAERNRLLEKAPDGWVFFVDSDEEVTEELDKEILDAARMTAHRGYYIKRRDYFFGKWLKFGETGDIRLLRLGKKNAGKWVRKVHEYWDINNVGLLKNPLLHYPHKNIKSFIEKINFYTELEREVFKYKNLGKPFAKFVLNYFIKLGFLDGMAGFVHVFMMAFQSIVMRVKEYEKTFNTSNRC